MKYHRLTKEERYQIYALKKEGLSQSAIARNIGKDKSTISRELRRNKGQKGYRPKQAHTFAEQRESSKPKHQRLGEKQIKYIEEKIKLKWSPEQISGKMKIKGMESVSHETIYRYLQRDKKAGGTLYKHLRHKSKKYKRRYGSNDRSGQISNKCSIEDRPDVVDKKERIGDLEIDLVIGKDHKQALVTVVDRKSKFTIIKKVENKKATTIKEALIDMILPIKRWTHTITSDNGKEFASFDEISKALNADYYFCHPYSSWERGLNENTNGLIRQYFPKGSSFKEITQKQVLDVQNSLNYRPRKTLGFKTPAEVFFGNISEFKNSA